MGATDSLLSLQSVTSGYGRVRIVDDVSLDVAAHEILAVIGRNGVGKTTLLKTMIGALRVMAGRIFFNTGDVTPLSATKRARLGIGYVPQGRGIFGKMTVEQNLVIGGNVGDARSEASIERAFEFFPILRERLSQRAGSMSGGEQQQLAIGRVLVGKPDIILLDEPSEGIQPNIVRDIGQAIRSLRDRQRMTIVIVEQNLELIRAVADRCVVMEKGRIIATVSPEDLADPELAKRYLAV